MTTLIDSLLDEIVTRALAEDLAGGDLTTEATISVDERAIGRAVAHSPLVLAGGDVFARVFSNVDRGLRVERHKADGERAQPGDVLLSVEGSARSILFAERTALNFIQRMSGVATLARRYVDALPAGSRTRIVDTRKTTPGLRALERYAVRAGGGFNHRNDLGSAVLIKDNHIVAAGGIRPAIERARAYAPHTTRIEIEVETLSGLDQALSAGADVVLLDNFEDAELEQAVSHAQGRAVLEVSGRITLERVGRIGALGVDVISVGALTHSAPAADIGLDLAALE
ncbi:MAG: carboxylating nicotinate-nucleotide diphosphorylase [Polyangiaceae bacterium]